MFIVFYVITFIIGIFAISFILKGEDANHKLYSVYLGICTTICTFCNLPELTDSNPVVWNPIDILKDQPTETLMTLVTTFIISFIASLVAFRFSSNTTNSKFTYFIKFIIIQIVVFVALSFVINYIITLF